MNKIVQFGLIGLSAVALTACGGDSNNDGITEAAFSDLAATGLNGYKINVDIDSDEDFTNITYYFCTDFYMDYDYAAVTPEYGEWDGDEPDFDYGNLSHTNNELDFDSFGSNPDGYTISSETEVLEEGQAYDLMIWDDVPTGAVHINRISEFDCDSIEVPEPIMM